MAREMLPPPSFQASTPGDPVCRKTTIGSPEGIKSRQKGTRVYAWQIKNLSINSSLGEKKKNDNIHSEGILLKDSKIQFKAST